MPTEDVTTKDATVAWEGKDLLIRYHRLGHRLKREARDAAMFYESGAPKYFQPFKYAEELMARMIESVDGVPFTRAMLNEWPEEFGDKVMQAVGIMSGTVADDAFFRKSP